MFKPNNMNKYIEAVAAVILIIFFAISCTKPEVPNNGGDNNGQNDSIVTDSIVTDSIVDVHGYADLGLPSGTLWATCNVGADVPEDFGDYFAWGETAPKSVYSWSNYKYGALVSDRYAFTKYCSDSIYGFNGFVDSLTFLEPSDDAATANWGADWRMPTGKEWQELFDKTTYMWTDLNGVKGWCFTGFNGNSIFLPAAGYWWDSSFNGDGGSIYWSNSLNTTYPNRAWAYYANTETFHLCGSNERNSGQSVRPVRKGK